MLQVREPYVVLTFLVSHRNRPWLVGHIAENCSSEQRLCYNCRQPGHESAACPQPRSVAAKQCYSCGGVGHIQAECPSLRLQNNGQKCYVSIGVVTTRVSAFLSSSTPSELWPVWTLRALLPQWCGWRFRLPCTPAWTWTEHLHPSPGQVLPLRRTEPYG